MSTLAAPEFPEVKEYLGGLGGASDQAIRKALAAETVDQASRCRVEPYTDALAEALKRRVAHNLAMKNLPLGVQIDDIGATRLSSSDPEVRRLEAPYRKLVLG